MSETKSGQLSFIPGRILVWFSCGAASACAAKLALEKYAGTDEVVEILYCDTLAYESDDNPRFMRDCEKWFGQEIKLLKSDKYTDIFDVFNKTGYIVGPRGATCTDRLKREVRKKYQQPEDTHVFGFTADEVDRILRFEENNSDIYFEWILEDHGITKKDCYSMVMDAGIELPLLYRQGYKNNNCIGCVKGQMGYWNKIRRDYPEAFERMAKEERKHDVAINKKYIKKDRIRVFLDELHPDAGRFDEEPDFECGPQCVIPPERIEMYDGKI
ncbi:MAG: hypothetical protein KAJ10_02820 [Thermodesulfovibrionia bacterium]|nr:hypothetical protein [Thermodesulfovibrionia bacterium]